MQLKDWGEEGFLAWLAESLGGAHSPAWADVPVGDDAAVFQTTAGMRLVATADAMVESIHFPPSPGSVALARRLLAANLSDLAAMGARPRAALLTLGAPADTDRAWLEAFFSALRDACRENETWLAGGDVTRDTSLHLNLFLLGEVEPEGILRMSGGRPGDDLWTTGTLGDSAAGLLALQQGREEDFAELVRIYREGMHRWREMREIVRVAGPTAATDISDGLATDLPRLCRACGCGAEVHPLMIPVSPLFQSLTSIVDCDSLTLGLTGGEDFEVLFSASPNARAALEEQGRSGVVQLTRIGNLVDSEPGRIHWLGREGLEIDLDVKGYDHFRGTV